MRYALRRRQKARETGQLWLLPELEWAPYPAGKIPARIYDMLRQIPLFFPEIR